MKKTVVFLVLLFLWLLYTSCSVEKIPIPNFPDTVQTVFDPGKVKYIPINPPWEGEQYDFVIPTDMVISLDDYIFVADSGAARILVLNKSGEVVESDEYGNDFTPLKNIMRKDSIQQNIHPTGIAIDSKLNLFIVENSNVVYVWNQYVNNIGVDSLATAVTYYNPDTDDRKIISDFSESYELEESGYILQGQQFVHDEAMIDSLLSPHPFYVCSEGARFVSVSAAPFGYDYVYVADDINARIAILRFVRSAFVKLKNGTRIWQHRGVLSGFAATQGTGAGTVNHPRGMFTDNDNNILYTQVGENFGVHKIKYVPGADEWVSVFNLGEAQIMDLGRFDRPHDVVVDESGNIFVVNTGQNEIQEFDGNGKFLRKIGLAEVQIDTTVIDTVITSVDGSPDTAFTERDTLITRYYNNVLNEPRSIYADGGVVYVLDTGNQRILRYRLSNDIDVEIPQ